MSSCLQEVSASRNRRNPKPLSSRPVRAPSPALSTHTGSRASGEIPQGHFRNAPNLQTRSQKATKLEQHSPHARRATREYAQRSPALTMTHDLNAFPELFRNFLELLNSLIRPLLMHTLLEPFREATPTPRMRRWEEARKSRVAYAWCQ